MRPLEIHLVHFDPLAVELQALQTLLPTALRLGRPPMVLWMAPVKGSLVQFSLERSSPVKGSAGRLCFHAMRRSTQPLLRCGWIQWD